ncbi:MAG: OB-fold nucleic acid binding domain-containing protein [Nitrososphaerota archaeon]|nr:hypothetical protein [Candidatus Aenigmarchaeota archaeon]
MENQRITALKARIDEIVNGKFVHKENFESSYVLTNYGRKLIRIRVLGTIVEKFIKDDKSYGVIVLDDGFETIRAKVFKDVEILDKVTEGDVVDIIGKVRKYEDEIYILIEAICKVDPNWENLRLLELEEIYNEQKSKIEKIKELQKTTADVSELKKLGERAGIKPEDIDSILEALESYEEKPLDEETIKEIILDIIEKNDTGNGVEYSELIFKSGLPEKIVDKIVAELLEKAICYEPHAGRIKKL